MFVSGPLGFGEGFGFVFVASLHRGGAETCWLCGSPSSKQVSRGLVRAGGECLRLGAIAVPCPRPPVTHQLRFGGSVTLQPHTWVLVDVFHARGAQL